MSHSIYKITSLKIVAPYTLELKFNDNKIQIIDFKDLLHGEMYSPLNDLNFFDQVKIDPEVSTIVWPNGADFDPETLYNWEEYKDELIRRARKWEVATE